MMMSIYLYSLVIFFSVGSIIVLFYIARKHVNDSLQSKNTDQLLYQQHRSEYLTALANQEISEAEFAELDIDLKRQLLIDAKITTSVQSAAISKTRSQLFVYGIPVLFSILLLAIAPQVLYQRWGNALGLENYEAKRAEEEQAIATIQQMVTKLNLAVEKDPQDNKSWYFLARAYMSLARYSEALVAYDKVISLSEKDSDLYAEVAQAIYIANARQVTPKVQQYFDEALKLNSKHPPTLHFLGNIAYENKDYQKALDYWQILYPLLPESETKIALKEKIDEIKILIGK